MSSDTLVPPILHLPDGLVGLPELGTLEVVPVAGGLVLELIAPDVPGLGWVVAAADDVQPGMTDRLRTDARIAPDEVVLVLLSSGAAAGVVTANLAGPLVVAPDGTARQLILEDPAFGIRVPVGLLPARASDGPSPIRPPLVTSSLSVAPAAR
jgi:hypothetical protein